MKRAPQRGGIRVKPEQGEVCARQDNLLAYSLSKMVDGRVPEEFSGADVPVTTRSALTWDELVAEMKRKGRVIGVPGRVGQIYSTKKPA